MVIVGGSMLIMAPQITALFSDDPVVLRYGTSCIRILGIGFPMYAVGMIMTQALNGAGDTASPSALNFVSFWIVQIPLALWLARGFEFGPNGVFIAEVIAESLLTLLSIFVFRRGRWKQHLA